MEPSEMEVGQRYRIWFKVPGTRKVKYSIMDYLGQEAGPGQRKNHLFNARPVAGTQAIAPSWIKFIEQVEQNTPITLNKIAP